MKSLEPIQIGDYTIQLTIEEGTGRPAETLLFTATCNGERMQNRMTLAGPHDHSMEQLKKDVARHATKLALELGAKLHSKDLKAKLLSGG